MLWKECTKCHRVLPQNNKYFHRESSNKDGLRSDCKLCNCDRVNRKYVIKDYVPPKGFKPLNRYKRYYISKHGKVWSKKLGRLMKPHKHSKYKYLQLTIDGVCRKVHQLVLEAFVGMCPRGMEGCHNDGNPENNNLNNLRWDTRSSNVKDSVKHGTHPVAKLSMCDVYKIKQMLRNKIKQNTIAKIFNVNPSTISCIQTGKVWNYVHLGQ